MDFISGMFVGAIVGFFAAALCAAGKDDRQGWSKKFEIFCKYIARPFFRRKKSVYSKKNRGDSMGRNKEPVSLIIDWKKK